LCPEGVEATLYASLMSLNNAAMGAAALLGAAMMKLFGITSSNFDHLSLLLLTCNLMSLLPLPLVGWVPDSSTAAAAAAAAVEEGDQGSADAADMELGTAAAGRV
jgi:Ca2+/H+ antiporter